MADSPNTGARGRAAASCVRDEDGSFADGVGVGYHFR